MSCVPYPFLNSAKQGNPSASSFRGVPSVEFYSPEQQVIEHASRSAALFQS